MMLNLTSVDVKYFNILMRLLNLFLKKLPEKFKKSVDINPEIMLELSEIEEPSNAICIIKNQIKRTEPESTITVPSTYLNNKKVSTANFSADIKGVTLSITTQLSDSLPKTFIKATSHPQPPSLCIIYNHHKEHKV